MRKRLLLPGIFLALVMTGVHAAELPVVVIDAGHGGRDVVDESSPNNAESRSAALGRTVYERDLTLDMATRVAAQINASGKLKAVMTRTTDVNVGMTERARVAHGVGAVALVSLHFNDSETHRVRGTEAILQSVRHGNSAAQHAKDTAFGDRLTAAVVAAIRPHSRGANARETKDFDAKPEGSHLFRNLRSTAAGKAMLACFLEIEFMDHLDVASWLYEQPGAEAVRQEIAAAIARSLVSQLGR